MCKMIGIEFPLAFKEIQENLDDDTKQKIVATTKRQRMVEYLKYYIWSIGLGLPWVRGL